MVDYKTLLREIEETLTKWREILFSWMGEINVSKILPKFIFRNQCNEMQIKIPSDSFFMKKRKQIVKLFRNTNELK